MHASPTQKQQVKSCSDTDICWALISWAAICYRGLVHGARIAMLVGVVSMGIASIIGILLGAIAGYFGDSGLQVSRITLWLNLFFSLFCLDFMLFKHDLICYE